MLSNIHLVVVLGLSLFTCSLRGHQHFQKFVYPLVALEFLDAHIHWKAELNSINHVGTNWCVV